MNRERPVDATGKPIEYRRNKHTGRAVFVKNEILILQGNRYLVTGCKGGKLSLRALPERRGT